MPSEEFVRVFVDDAKTKRTRWVKCLDSRFRSTQRYHFYKSEQADTAHEFLRTTIKIQRTNHALSDWIVKVLDETALGNVTKGKPRKKRIKLESRCFLGAKPTALRG